MPCSFQSLLPCKIYVFVSQSARNICKFFLYSALRSMLSAILKDVPPSDCNSANEAFQCIRLDLLLENGQAWRQDATLANYVV